MTNISHFKSLTAYLHDAQALTLTETIAETWMDYTTSEIRMLRTEELRPAARRAVKEWSSGGRRWRIDVETYCQAIRANRKDRWNRDQELHGFLTPEGLEDEPGVSVQWLRHARTAIGAGLDREAAVAYAWRSIGRTPPRRQITSDGVSGIEKARMFVESLRRA